MRVVRTRRGATIEHTELSLRAQKIIEMVVHNDALLALDHCGSAEFHFGPTRTNGAIVSARLVLRIHD